MNLRNIDVPNQALNCDTFVWQTVVWTFLFLGIFKANKFQFISRDKYMVNVGTKENGK